MGKKYIKANVRKVILAPVLPPGARYLQTMILQVFLDLDLVFLFNERVQNW